MASKSQGDFFYSDLENLKNSACHSELPFPNLFLDKLLGLTQHLYPYPIPNPAKMKTINPNLILASIVSLSIWSCQSKTPETSTSEPEIILDNQLSIAEKEEGWKLLFDGSTLDGWHVYNKEKPNLLGRQAMESLNVIRKKPMILPTYSPTTNMKILKLYLIGKSKRKGIAAYS